MTGRAIEVGARLASARLRRGWGQAELAQAAGIAPSYLSRVETGKVQPTFKKVVHILDALGADVSELVDPRSSKAGHDGPCPVTSRGRCLIDLISPRGEQDRYTPREVRMIRDFARWLHATSPTRAKAIEVLLEDLLTAAGTSERAPEPE